ncbi:DUF4232 domain-containing protein [Pseudonocardia sp. GCM10023141]|uniref:DUF4232 domain-containing protein n=1 Tax=Pseudonocardia sp. GCM10023141 TaxID=3252653 RepID=UPI0036D29F1D
MIFTAKPIAGLGLLAAALVLSSCSGPAPSSPPVAPVPPPSTSAAAPAGAEGSGRSDAARKCLLSDLGPAVGETTGAAGQRQTLIVWTNTASTPCTMTGFSGIDLKGPDDPAGPTYSLPRSSVAVAAVRLNPGDKAHSTISWLPPSDGPGWTPTQILATPPDETHSAVLPWPGGAVLRQDAATHPGTYVGPVQPGATG